MAYTVKLRVADQSRAISVVPPAVRNQRGRWSFVPPMRFALRLTLGFKLPGLAVPIVPEATSNADAAIYPEDVLR